ncbi:hypothetical protein HYW39_01735, partial [Candidatus Curtissbacteria bacterium]|nr:hypothetical protein [Candidatus Curtissbacteria bacterium]
EDLEAIRKATDDLGQALQKIGPAMSSRPPGADTTGAGVQEEIKGEAESKESEEKPVEGEVVEEEKKE